MESKPGTKWTRSPIARDDVVSERRSATARWRASGRADDVDVVEEHVDDGPLATGAITWERLTYPRRTEVTTTMHAGKQALTASAAGVHHFTAP